VKEYNYGYALNAYVWRNGGISQHDMYQYRNEMANENNGNVKQLWLIVMKRNGVNERGEALAAASKRINERRKR